ncbi:Protein of unknown function [Pyronema omphalodes CBS 100304]|uniref:Uncharacterized protein n=1 Tax=Pyronema omphalodes (strain CBS 100304) TaxID=1076935 RepID=U4LA74_PYROM|nr:Protein of unknown function [Pyronema omphalodes CBS 100304]
MMAFEGFELRASMTSTGFDSPSSRSRDGHAFRVGLDRIGSELE